MKLRRLALRLAFGAALLWVDGAVAATVGDPRVVILRPERTDVELDRALVYLQGELVAAGFAVTLVAVAEPVTPKALRQVGEEQEAFATLTVLRSNGNTTADVWIGDRVTGKTSVRTLATTAPERSGKLLALRAVDLLKTSLAESQDPAGPPADVVGVAPPTQVPRQVREFVRSPPSPFAVRVHAVGLGWPSPFAPAFGAELGLSYRPHRSIGLRAVGIALGGGATENAAGEVRASEQLALLELTPILWRGAAAQFAVVGGAGVLRLAVTGEARPPYFGQRETLLTFAASLGAELGLDASSNARFTVGARALTFAPDPVVLAYDEEYPMQRLALLGSLGLELGF